MNNEPVAWMYKETVSTNMITGGIPLYVHPPAQQWTIDVKVKDLTDDEIEKLAKQFGVVGLHEDAGLFEFAKAILRKAQEK